MASESEAIASVSDLGDGRDEMNEDNVMKIMIATDNHLGYIEKDPVRGEDSFIAFEEILQQAVANDVDFILLGGDLFHDATPSQNSIYKCMNLLRKYTLGSKAINLEFLSDQSVNFKECFNSTVNYEDPNLNVSIPVFSIHGNHDDPSGYGLLSTLDILATSGLVNYFGKRTDLTNLEINPILLKKGVTQLAIYGLSYIHDSRLVRLFGDSKVIMKKPDESTGNWFNLMVLHQNRANRGHKTYLPEEILPEFLDFIVWGHEHDCRIVPEQHYKHQFHVCQPGSSTPTSLSEGESIQKHCGILSVYKDKFKMEPIPLKTVRPFVFKSIEIQDYAEKYGFDEGDTESKVMDLCKEIVENLILEAEEKLTGHPQQPTLPLIRLRCLYENDDTVLHETRFNQEFAKRVANAGNLIKFKKIVKRTKGEAITLDSNALKEMMKSTRNKVEDVVDEFFEAAEESKKLQVFSTKILSEITNRIVNRNDTNAADSILRLFNEKANEHFAEKLPREDQMDEEFKNFRDNKLGETYQDILKTLDERGCQKLSPAKNSTSSTSIDSKSTGNSTLAPVFNPDNSAKTSTQKATKARGGSTRGRGRGKGAASSTSANETKTTSRTTSKSKMPTLMETLGAASKSTRPQREKTKANTSRAIYISDSD